MQTGKIYTLKDDRQAVKWAKQYSSYTNNFITCPNIKDILSEMDYLDFSNRGTWYGLPKGISGDIIERVLYNRNTGCMFYIKELDKFYFLPYTLSSDNNPLDVYGRYTHLKPIRLSAGNGEEQELIPNMQKTIIYDELDIEEDNIEQFYDSAIVLRNSSYYNNGQQGQSRLYTVESLLMGMSEVFPLARTNLINNSGVSGIKVNTENESVQVELASKAVYDSALKGKPWIPVIGNLDFQQLTGSMVNVEGYLSYFQSLDNFRLKSLGLTSGGIFEKKSHMLQDEMAMNSGKGSRILDDSIRQRQEFCLKCNLLWGLNMWYEPNENAINFDNNFDGKQSLDYTTNNMEINNNGGKE